MHMPGKRFGLGGRAAELRETLFLHPFQLALAMVLLINGAVGMLASAMTVLPQALDITFSSAGALAGLMILFGTFSNKSKATAIEQSGLLLAAGIYAAYMIGLTYPWQSPIAYLRLASGSAVTVAFVLRAIAVKRNRQALLAGLKQVER